MIPLEPPAVVEVDSDRRYIAVNDSACTLLGYTRDELLQKTIDEISAPSGAHVPIMFDRFKDDKQMSGLFALRRKDGQIVWVRFESSSQDGRNVATWTHYKLDPLKP
jgi:PAS domain S-box-containing protein